MFRLGSQRRAELQHAYGRTRSKCRKICVVFRSVIWIAIALLPCVDVGATTPPAPGHVFYDLVVSARGELIIAHTDGVFRSIGESGLWKRTLPNRGYRLVDAGAEGVYLLSGDEFGDIFQSRDAGATWARTGTAAGVRSIVAHDGALHGCAQREIRSSRDGGKTWTRLATVTKEVRGCSFMRLGPGAIYAGEQPESLFASRIGSDRWTPIGGTGRSGRIPAEAVVRDLHVDAAGTLYASTARRQLDNNNEERVYRSRDRGVTWHRFGMTQKYTEHRVVGLRGLTVYLDCIDAKSLQADVCSWSDRAPMQTLGYMHSPGIIGHVTDTRLVPGANGRLYTVDMYGVHRWDNGLGIWQPLENNGIPDPYTGMVR